jgi:hypothetical protein
VYRVREITDVYGQRQREHINTFCGKNVAAFLKADGTDIYHSALNVLC